jgi:hypothetical protein
MANVSFLTHMGIAKMGHIGDAITTAIVNFDPETASVAQIAEYRTHCDDIEHRLAKAEQTFNAASKAMNELQVKLDRDREAAKSLRTTIGATTDQATITKLTTAATTIITQMKQIGGDEMDGSVSGQLFDTKTDLTQAQSDLTEWQNVHQQAIQQLTTAESTLQHAKSDLERAQHDQERARMRAQQADADANLKSGLNTGGGVAIAAMQASADKARENARAASLHVEAMKEAKGGDVDAIVAETLAKAKPASSVLDDLNRL